jgi:hypothetical protein
MKHLKNFNEFVLNEGGNAVKGVRSIRQDEVQRTIDNIKEVVFPLLKIHEWGYDAILIGSAGRKALPSDLSGDLDIGIVLGVDKTTAKNIIHDKLKTLPYELHYMPGLGITSVKWPIEGDESKGYVQVDFIAIESMEWAKFAFYTPDYRKNESKYKSAHRNWMFAAIMSAIKENVIKDSAGNVLQYDAYIYNWNEGLKRVTKSFEGSKGGIIKTHKKVKEELLSVSPKEFIELAFGPGYKEDDVKTYEQVDALINNDNFKWKKFLPEIKEQYVKFLERMNLPIPSEI